MSPALFREHAGSRASSAESSVTAQDHYGNAGTAAIRSLPRPFTVATGHCRDRLTALSDHCATEVLRYRITAAPPAR
jgi:hypothetical protein